MKHINIILVIFLVICLLSFVDNSKNIKIDFSTWVKSIPSLNDFDKLNSTKKINSIKNTATFCPLNSKIIGKALTIGNEKGDTMNYFIIYSVKIKGVYKYFMGIFNIKGKLFYCLEIFDSKFLELNPKNYCLFYRKNQFFIIENFSNNKMISNKRIDFFKILIKKKMI